MAEVTNPSGGTAAPAPEYSAQRAAMLKGEDPAPPAEKKAEGDAAAEAEDATEDAADAGDDQDDAGEESEDDDSEADGDDDDAGDEGEGEEPADAKEKYSAALLKLQKEEKSLRAFKATVLEKERTVAARETKVQASERELAAFIADFRVDPFNVLLREGLITEEDAAHFAKQAHYHTAEALKDPRSKPEAERLRRERARELEDRKTRQAVEQLRQEREAEKAQAAKTAELNTYVAKVDEAAATYKAKTPELAAAMEKNPAKVRRELLQIANELSNAKNAFADPKLVVLAWTKQRKELLAELGIATPAAAPAAKTDKKAKSKSAVEKKGPADAAAAAATNAQSEAEKAEAAYRKELQERLKG